MTERPVSEQEQEPADTGPIVRDKRRIDPETGAVREQPAPPQADPADAGSDGGVDGAGAGGASLAPLTPEEELERELAERTADLQRVQAEYANYRRRVDRDRAVVRDTAVGNVLTNLLPVLDDIGRAREHDELAGGFKAVAESLERTVGQLGLESFGEVGDDFDPRIHEALMHGYSDEVAGPVCQAVLAVGYRLGDRILRPARVAVAEPEGLVVPAHTVVGQAAGDVDSTSPDGDDGVPGDDNSAGGRSE